MTFFKILLLSLKKRKIPGVLVVMIKKVKKEEKFLLVKQKNQPVFTFISGSLLWGETFEKAAKRETKEEVGVTIENLVWLPIIHEFHYNFLNFKIGSFQQIFLTKVSPSIKLNISKSEIEGCQWLRKNEVFQVLSYEELQNTFGEVVNIFKF